MDLCAIDLWKKKPEAKNLVLLSLELCHFGLCRMVPWWLGHLRLDTVTLRPAPSDTVMIHPTNVYILWLSDPQGSNWPTTPKLLRLTLRRGSKCWLWQSDPQIIRSILCSAWRGGGSTVRTATPTWGVTHTWVRRTQAWPNLTPNMVRPTQRSPA